MAFRCRNDRHWSAEFVSDGVVELTGYTPDDFTSGRIHWTSLMHPEDLHYILDAAQESMRERRPYRNEYRIRHRDGFERWIWALGRGVDYEGERPAAFEGFAADITDRKRAEEAVQQSEERFRTISEAIPVMLWVGGADGSVLHLNRRWVDYTGKGSEAVSGYGWSHSMHPDDRPRVLAQWERCIRTGEIHEGECRYRRRDGTHRWHYYRAIPVRAEDGAIEAWYGASVDIHDKKLAEQAMLEADRRKDEFLATLAHELRNPLAPLRAALDVLKLSRGEAGRFEEMTAVMDRQLSQLVRLTDDLLDVSRITSDRIELRTERVDLGAILRQAVETCRPLAEERRHALVVELPPQPLRASGDAARLVQVFGNLVHNACKFTEPGGRIRVVAESRGDEVVVAVEDDGPGIPRDELDRIFEMFTQLDRSSGSAMGGLGIGLTLVKRFVALHGGTVEAHSAGAGARAGSRFVVRLPVSDAAQSTGDPAADDSRSAASRPQRVLVVDDNRDAVDSLAALLTVFGQKVEIARDGAEALEKARTMLPDAILLDLGLPGISGHDVCRAIRAQSWGRRIAIIALTGWGQAEDRRRTAEAGFDGHLVKPVDTRELRRLLEELPETARAR